MEKKPIPRHMKMYKASPRLERKEDGSMGITKSALQPEEVNAETQDNAAERQVAEEVARRQAQERLDMYHRHEKEFLEVSQKSPQAENNTEDSNNKIEENKGA